MTAWNWVLLSGIPSSHPGGTGQLMCYLENELLRSQRYDGTIMYSPDGESLSEDQLSLLADIPKVVIFHPQMLGLAETISLLASRKANHLVTHLYLLDSFFFCRRSYNHIAAETAPCLRCIGVDGKDVADRMGCAPWPKAEEATSRFIEALRSYVAAGDVHLYAQNDTQAEIARQHFGNSSAIEIVGLWCADWTEYFEKFLSNGISESSSGPYDVVYHGSRDMAKGLGWMLAVAEQTPELSYLVPLDRGPANFSGPPNVTIQPMRWNQGLFDAIKGASLTVVPSLWSAPCEGALVKSIITAQATAAVANSTSFASEIPKDICLGLPADPGQAADVLLQSMQDHWQPDSGARHSWAKNFYSHGIELAARIT